MEKIKAWLDSEDPDYHEGLILLAKNTKNRILVQNLNRRTHHKKLKYELQKIYDRNVTSSKIVKANKKQAKEDQIFILTPKTKAEDVNPSKKLKIKVVVNKKEVDYNDLPSSLKKIYDNTVEAYKIMRTMHEKLKLMSKAPDTQRAALVEQLTKLDDTIRGNWETIDKWDGTPDEPKNDSNDSSGDNKGADDKGGNSDPGIDAKRIGTNRKYITSNKTKLAKLIEAKDAKADALRDKVQQRVDELRKADVGFEEDTVTELKQLGIKFE